MDTSSSKPPLCIYHGNCQDGFAAAWCVNKALRGEVEFYPGVYQNPPPDVTGRSVIIVDFSYKRDVLAAMATQASSVVILDHHQSAAQDLSEFVLYPPVQGRGLVHCFKDMDTHRTNIIAEFDMERSGAGMAWDYFMGGTRPPLIDLIEDRDLWRFRHKDTRYASAALFSYIYDFTLWDKLMRVENLKRLIADGEAIERAHHQDIANTLPVVQREMVIGGVQIPVANLPIPMTSDAGQLMAREHASGMAACYWDTPEGRVFSLRSIPSGPNVAEIAKGYGGGGHAHAAGFRVPQGWEGDRLPTNSSTLGIHR